MSRTTLITSPGILCLSSVAILVLLLESTQAVPPDSAQKVSPATAASNSSNQPAIFHEKQQDTRWRSKSRLPDGLTSLE